MRVKMNWDVLVVFCVIGLLAGLMILMIREPKEPPDLRGVADDVKEGAAHVTEEAGEHFTKGVIDAIKDEFKGEQNGQDH